VAVVLLNGGGHASLGGRQFTSRGGREVLLAPEHGKFLNEEVFRPVCLLKVRRD